MLAFFPTYIEHGGPVHTNRSTRGERGSDPRLNAGKPHNYRATKPQQSSLKNTSANKQAAHQPPKTRPPSQPLPAHSTLTSKAPNSLPRSFSALPDSFPPRKTPETAAAGGSPNSAAKQRARWGTAFSARAVQASSTAREVVLRLLWSPLHDEPPPFPCDQ